MPKISVVMPVYNNEPYIRDAIESILNQTYADFEFIIINDGSKDLSLNIIQEYKKNDDRIIIISRENKGLSYSLNEGINISKGEYIARMDGDDISQEDRFEQQIKFLDRNKSIGILGSCVNIIGNKEIKSKFEKALNKSLDEKNAEDVIINYWYSFAHSSVMFRRNILTKLKGYKDYKAEDLELWLRALKNKIKICKLDQRLLNYRVYENSKSAIDNKNYDGAKESIKLRLDYIFDSNVSRKINCLIWGAGKSGSWTLEVLKNYKDKFNIVGFIDRYKIGQIEGVQIFKPENLENIVFDYMIIATVDGKREAMEKMKYMKIENLKGYFCVI